MKPKSKTKSSIVKQEKFDPHQEISANALELNVAEENYTPCLEENRCDPSCASKIVESHQIPESVFLYMLVAGNPSGSFRRDQITSLVNASGMDCSGNDYVTITVNAQGKIVLTTNPNWNNPRANPTVNGMFSIPFLNGILAIYSTFSTMEIFKGQDIVGSKPYAYIFRLKSSIGTILYYGDLTDAFPIHDGFGFNKKMKKS